MIRVFKHDQGRKTESLKRLLLQYIQKNELKKGDKLPSQSVLRQQLGLSGTTVIRAIRSLVEENILEVRDNVGTFVATDRSQIQSGCVIGLLGIPSVFRILPQYPMMLTELQNKLFRYGFQPMIFPTIATSDDIRVCLENYPKLQRAIEQSKIDAVVDFSCITDEDCQYLKAQKIPYFRESSFASPYSGLYLDIVRYFNEAVEDLLANHCRKPMLITSPNPQLKQLWLDVLKEKMPDCRNPEESICYATDSSRAIQLAFELKEKTDRPDSFVFLDESIGLYLLTAMDRIGLTQAHYDPFIISTATAEMPLLMPREKIIYYEMKLDEMMEQLAEIIAEALDFRTEKQTKKSVCYPLRRIGLRPLIKESIIK